MTQTAMATADPVVPRFLGRLLVATDGLADGDDAVDFAIAIAAQHGSAVSLCYAVNRLWALGEPNCAGPRGLARAVLAEARERVADAGIAVTADELDGGPADAILRYASAGDYDALVIGTRGERGFARVLNDSVADGVLRRTEIPVFVVSPNPSAEAPRCRSILVVVDDSRASREALDFALAFARSDRALLVVCELPSANASFDSFADRAKSERFEFESVVRAGDPSSAILRIARRCDADCIVLGTRGRGGLRRWTLDDVAENVARSSTVPIAIVRG